MVLLRSTNCVEGCSNEESINSLFLGLQFFGSIWHSIYRLLGISTATPIDFVEHAQQFEGSFGFRKANCLGLQVIWLANIWVVWKELNARSFCNTNLPLDQLLQCIKFHYLLWLKLHNSHKKIVNTTHGGPTLLGTPCALKGGSIYYKF